ncbi:inorganic phosphate transporter [candidate division KSB3 bacterium]|uniref:Inorganic phosphate transporter n=1 Tax=candidate division KSB3 bacterium TaxID=2044937 RepID=A0A9D5Q4W1_9BACT|nr:inorganic phosphate transporter [candidate division KSB3 bacterium]MBD3324134.1 inorganic phosphate transporter [candidate division KSB3 bacterium]
MFRLLSGIFLGWSLGANDSANIFGTAVASRVIHYRVAVTITAVGVVLGAVWQGSAGMHTVGGLTSYDLNSAFLASLAAALTVTGMTYLSLPVSTSQAVIGSILGIGFALEQPINWQGFEKVVVCWIGTPIGAMVISYVLYKCFQALLSTITLNLISINRLIKYGLFLSGAYGAYALGANNVANVTGVFAGAGLLTVRAATLLGGISIALGAVTYSKRVMLTVGGGLVKLDGFSAFIAVLSEAITVHIYAKIGVPVSTSQAIVGAVIGIGFVLGGRAINNRALLQILIGWISTPLLAGILAFFMLKAFVLAF